MQIPDNVRTLERDLGEVFGNRMQSIVLYGRIGGPGQAPASTLVLVDHLDADDLRGCAARVPEWHQLGLDTPLLMPRAEFQRALDVFPLEFGAILSNHAVVRGDDPFAGLGVEPADLRRACEVQARSHLLHLREGYLETGGRSDLVTDLIADSSAALAALLATVARLRGRSPDSSSAAAQIVERELKLAENTLSAIVAFSERRPPGSEQARLLFPSYLYAVELLVAHVDGWSAHSRHDS